LALFSTVTIDEHTADLFRSLSLSVKAAIVRHTFRAFATRDERADSGAIPVSGDAASQRADRIPTREHDPE